MLFKLTLILLLAIFIVFTIIYYMFSYKRLMVISSPIFMGPLSEISINKLKNMASNDPTSKTGIEIQNMLTNMLTYSSTDLDIPFLNKTFTHDKLLVNHNDFGYSYTFFIKIDNLDYKYNEEKEKYDTDHSLWLKFSLTASTLLILLYFISPSQLIEVISRINII